MAQPGGFVENRGQWQGPEDFRLQQGYHQVFFQAHRVRFRLYESHVHAHRQGHEHELPFGAVLRGQVFEMKLLGADSSVQAQPSQKLQGHLNFLLGRDTARWKAGVKRYQSLLYPEVYPHIDLRYQLLSQGLYKYEFVLKPGADPQQIRWLYQGLDTLGLVGANLVLKTAVETVVENAPYAYWARDGQELPCRFRLRGNTIGFDLGLKEIEDTLILDPELVFSTYTGASQDNWGFTATPASDQGAYAGGIIFGPPGNQAYPTVLGAFQDSMKGGLIDVAISKFAPDGRTLRFSTYFGGTRDEAPISTLEGQNGSLIFIGTTSSSDLPVTASAFDTSFNPGTAGSLRQGGFFAAPNGVDLYLAVLDSSGGNLLASTYLGGSELDGKNERLHFNFGDEFRAAIDQDAQGNIYLAASTLSPDMPITPGAGQDSLGGSQDGYLASFDPTLQNLRWARFLGGVSNEALFWLQLGQQNRLYFCGASESQAWRGLPSGGYQDSLAGKVDGIVGICDARNGNLLNFSYTGTLENDLAYLLDLDDQDRVHLFGQTYGNFPVIGPNVYSVANSSQFLQRFNSNLSQSDRATVFGSGTNLAVNISPTGLLVDRCGDISLAGFMTQSGNRGRALNRSANRLPLVDPYQDSTDGEDFYLMTLDASWQSLRFASYFGDPNSYDHVDGGTSRFDKDGSIYHAVCAGCGGSSTFPTTDSAFSQQNNSTNCNMAVMRFDFQLDELECRYRRLDGGGDTACVPYLLQFEDASRNNDIFVARYPDGAVDTLSNAGGLTVDSAGPLRIWFYALDTNCLRSDSAFLDFYALNPEVEAEFGWEYDSCEGENEVSFTSTSRGAERYRWSFGDGDSSNQANPSHRYPPGTYQVSLVVSEERCGRTDTLSKRLTVAARSNLANLQVDYDPCAPGQEARVLVSSLGYQLYSWRLNGQALDSNQAALNLSLEPGQEYQIEVELQDTVCGRAQTLSQGFVAAEDNGEVLMPNVFTPNGDGQNDFYQPLPEQQLDLLQAYRLDVYDRRGLLLHQSLDPEQAWDGKYQGQDMADGVYYYLLWYRNLCGRELEQNGFLHLKRGK